jgi:hypothetical protein
LVSRAPGCLDTNVVSGGCTQPGSAASALARQSSKINPAHPYLSQIVKQALTQGSRRIAIFAGDWRDFDFELGSLPEGVRTGEHFFS